MPSHGALEGLRVLEWGATTALAYAGKLLSDLGADVVKMEGPSGDPARRQAPFFGAAPDEPLSSRFVYLNTGKRSVPAGASGADQLAALCAETDVLITDETTRADIPPALPSRLVWCSVSPFGLVGPYAGYSGTHLTIFHSGGEGHLLPSGLGWELFPDRPPLVVGSEMGDYDTGASAAAAILAACMRQRRSGAGERIDVSAQEAQLTLNRTRLSRFSYDGVELRRGPSQYGIGGMIRCRNGYIQLVGMRPEHWDRLTSGPDGEPLRPPVDGSGRDAGEEEARRGDALRAWCAARDKDEVTRLLADAGCPVGAYAAPADLMASAQLAHRDFFQQIEQPGLGAVTLPGVP